jgi:MFS family permease
MVALRPVRSLLLAILIVMGGAGVMGTLVSLRLADAGAGALTIGLVATAYFVGLMIGSLRVARIVRRVGHIRAFAAFVALLAASTLAYTLQHVVLLWAGLRFIDGVCLAGVYVCLESWLNERAMASARGSVLAAYMIALYSGQAAGQFLLGFGRPATSPFVAASMLISLSIIPIALTRSISPAVGQRPPLPMRRLYRISPLGVVGAAVTGLILGAFYGLGAVYARRLGMNLGATASFMSAVIAGGVALQWPLGWLSDRLDRRRVIVGALAGGAVVAAAMAAAGATGAAGPLLFILGAVFGGVTFALYPLCVAHANDHVKPEERIEATGGLVLVYSFGAACGPFAAGTAMTLLGSAGLFVLIAACAGGATVFALWRLSARAPVPSELQQSYQLLPRTTPMSATLDPYARTEP